MVVIVFLVLAFGALALDIRAHRKPQAVSLTDAAKWSAIYIAVSLAFAAFVFLVRGRGAASLFLSGYVMEKALSVDNLVVFGLVFSYFGIKDENQHKVLHYGILGAVVFRLAFVTLGVGSLWLFGRLAELAFGAVVGWSAIKVLRGGDAEPVDCNSRWYMRAARSVMPNMGPLLVCMVAIECTDVMFAFDSVPTVIAVTRDPVLIYSAMIFAILGLRSLYFVLAALRRYLVYLDKAVAAILVFVAAKLVLHALLHWSIDPTVSLVVVLSLLVAGATLSLMRTPEASGAE